jgi:hypothetical protein
VPPTDGLKTWIKAINDRLDRFEADLRHKFDGFPQEYATNVEVESIRRIVEDIRADHVMRREIDDLKNTQTAVNDRVVAHLNMESGRRSTMIAFSGGIAVLLTAAFGTLWSHQLTPSDVRQQIQAESPWSADRQAVLNEIQKDETVLSAIQVRISEIESLDRFFCRTRQQAHLPGC